MMGNLIYDCDDVCFGHQFADWCMNYGKHGCRTPDTPFSLFEGMANNNYIITKDNNNYNTNILHIFILQNRVHVTVIQGY